MLDRTDAVPLEQLWKDPLHHAAVGQHVGHAAGYAQVVFEDHEFAARQPDQIGAHDRDVHVARHLQTAHLPPEMSAAVHHLPRHDTVGEDATLVINVAQEEIESGNALG